MKTYVLFHLYDFAQKLLVASVTFKTFLAGLPTVFSALLAETTTTFQPFSRQASVDSGPPTVFQAWLSACLFNALRRYAFWFFNCPPFLHNLHNSTSRSAQFQARSHPCKHVIAQCISYFFGVSRNLCCFLFKYEFVVWLERSKKLGSVTNTVRGISQSYLNCFDFILLLDYVLQASFILCLTGIILSCYLPNIKLSYFLISDLFAEKMWGKKAKGGQEEEQRLPEAEVTGALSQLRILSTASARNHHLPLNPPTFWKKCATLWRYNTLSSTLDCKNTLNHALPYSLGAPILHTQTGKKYWIRNGLYQRSILYHDITYVWYSAAKNLFPLLIVTFPLLVQHCQSR